MLRTLIRKRVLLLSLICLALITAAIFALPRSNSAADFSGREILSVTRIAHGGADYANLQYVTVKANGFVNAVAFGGMGANPLGGMAEVTIKTSRCAAVWKLHRPRRSRDELTWCSPARLAAA